MGIFGLYQWIVSLCRHESGQVCTRVPVPSSNLEATSIFIASTLSPTPSIWVFNPLRNDKQQVIRCTSAN